MARPVATSSLEPVLPIGPGAVDQGGQQQVVELLRAAGSRRHLGPYFFQGGGVEAGQVTRLDGQAPAQLHLAGAPFLQRGVVEEGVRLAVDYLVRKHRRLDGVDEMRP